ncbi:SDR family NAD(P)-dependent oxidoreductase [Saccharothrix sp. SC076]|nr:SDR family NAD(P)-dependent oxidoreductase [Saccharothrix obliqua]
MNTGVMRLPHHAGAKQVLDETNGSPFAEHMTVNHRAQTVLLTGASSGLGAAFARRVHVTSLINNAGIGSFAPFTEADSETLAAEIAVDVVAPVWLTAAFLPGMISAGVTVDGAARYGRHSVRRRTRCHRHRVHDRDGTGRPGADRREAAYARGRRRDRTGPPRSTGSRPDRHRRAAQPARGALQPAHEPPPQCLDDGTCLRPRPPVCLAPCPMNSSHQRRGNRAARGRHDDGARTGDGGQYTELNNRMSSSPGTPPGSGL